MVDLRILKKHGCSADAWRKLFEGHLRPRANLKGEPVTASSPKREKIDELMERMWSRIRTGRDWNFTNYNIVHAMDLIWDAPFRQVSPTLVSSICAKYGKNTEEVKNGLSGLGLNLDNIIVDSNEIDPKTKKPVQMVNVPSFFAIMVPLVRAYLTIRRAKLVNDRNREPFFEYKSAVQSKKNRVKCEVLTSRIQETARAYDYFGTLNQAVFAMLLYPSGCLLFTKEEWDYSEQLRLNASGKEEKFNVREGLRYHCPHAARTFWDAAHPMRTFNSDIGCEFAGYWQVMRYGDILDNDGFYNRDQISVGDTGWFNGHPSFWRTVYNNCSIKVPVIAGSLDLTEQADREQFIIDNPYYTGTMRDASVMLCEYREKLIPSQWGLGTYDYEVWCRFVVAGDGTIVYAAPMGYVPVCVFRDHGDDKRVADATLALQLAPYQDQLSNLFTQFLLAVKQNLANLTLVESSVVKPEMIRKLMNDGETYFRGMNFLPYDSKGFRVLQVDPRAAIIPNRFPPLDTNGIVMAMKLVLDMAERVLQFSSQEIAQAATHEQTKAEVETINRTTTNIIEYTGTAVDAGMSAMAHQNYEALINYGTDEFYAQIPSDHSLTDEQLTEMGINQENADKEETLDKKIRVRAKKSAAELDSFAVLPPSSKRVSNWEAAQAITQFWQSILSNPQMMMALGPQQMVDIANQMAKLAGLKLDTDLRDMTDENQKKAANDAVKQATEAVLGIVRTETKQGLEVIMSVIKDLTDKVNALYKMAGLDATPTPNATAGSAGTVGPAELAQQPGMPALPPPAPDAVPLGAG